MRSSQRGLKSKDNVAGCWSLQRRPKQFQTLRRGRRSRHKLRPPPNCHRGRASVRALKSCPAPCEVRVAAPSSRARARVLLLRPRFRGENLSHHVRLRERALADRETQLHVFLRPLPFGESRSRFRAHGPTIVVNAARTNRELSGLARRDRPVFLPSAAHDAPPLPPSEEEFLCASHPVRDRRERDKLARSRLQRASCALLLRLSP